MHSETTNAFLEVIAACAASVTDRAKLNLEVLSLVSGSAQVFSQTKMRWFVLFFFFKELVSLLHCQQVKRKCLGLILLNWPKFSFSPVLLEY